jgi:hypothetical protein
MKELALFLTKKWWKNEVVSFSFKEVKNSRTLQYSRFEDLSRCRWLWGTANSITASCMHANASSCMLAGCQQRANINY